MTQRRSISFSLILVDSLHLKLKGDIDIHPNGTYTITDIRRVTQEVGSLLPPIKLRKKGDHWVHTDSDKETDISLAIGSAIDQDPDLHI